MRSNLFYIFSILFVLSCSAQSENETKSDNNTKCDCKSLILDQKYNRFYLTDKKQPFTGTCESFYPNGNLKMERHYVDGKYHGDVIDYYDNGQIKSISQYKKHFINGYVKTFTKDGKLKSHIEYKQSTAQQIVYPKSN